MYQVSLGVPFYSYQHEAGPEAVESVSLCLMRVRTGEGDLFGEDITD